MRTIVISFILSLSCIAQTKINLVTQTKGVLPIARGGTGISTPCCVLLTPVSDQIITSSAFHFSIFDIPFANFSLAVRNFPAEMPQGQQPLYSFGAANTVSPMWIFGDRDGSDTPTTSALYVDEFITNNIDRPNSQQGTALAVQARATGSGKFGFIAAATFNTQYNGSSILNQAIQIWAATPRNQGSGIITNTVGVHIANQFTPGATTARGIEFEILPTTNRLYQLYIPGGNNWMGPNNTWARKITLGCPNTEQVCTDDFAALDVQPNGTMKYCSDCAVTTPVSCTNVTNTAACTCAAGGTGAIAKRINSVWLCN